MKKNKLYFFLVVALICSFAFVGCTPTPEPTQAPAPVIPTDEPTAVPPTAVPPTEVPPTAEPTAVPPTEVPPTEAPVEVATEAPADAVVVTEEPAVVIPDNTGVTVTAGQSTNCRKYPMRNSKELGFLKADSAVAVHGQDSTGEWFYISNPTNPGERMCWVWAGSSDRSRRCRKARNYSEFS